MEEFGLRAAVPGLQIIVEDIIIYVAVENFGFYVLDKI